MLVAEVAIYWHKNMLYYFALGVNLVGTPFVEYF